MRTTNTRRYGVAELAALLADLARPVTDAAAAEGLTWRAVRERTHRAAAWVVALVTRRRTAVRTVAVAADDGRRNSPRVVWAARVNAPAAEPVGFRSVAWEPADLMTTPADPAFAFRGVRWEPDMNEPADPAFISPVAASSVWGVELPRSRRVRRQVPDSVTCDVPSEPAPSATPAATAPAGDEWASATAVELIDPPAAEFVTVAEAPTPAAKPARKPRARKPATPKAMTMTSAAQVTAPPAEPAAELPPRLARLQRRADAAKVRHAEQPTPVAAPVYTADVRPVPLAQLVRHGVGRFSAAATVRGGWVTDSKVMIRVPDADREALAAKIEDNGGRPVPAADVILAAIDPRPFVLTGREWDADQEPVGVLTREDGEVRRVELRLYLTLLKHTPKGTALYAAPAAAPATDRRHRRPAPVQLVAHAGAPTAYTRDAAAGVLMPLVTDGQTYTPWHADDEPLTLRGGRGAGSSYTLPRGLWRTLLPYLTGATAADLEAAGGKVPLTAKERAKLAPVIDAAGGAAAVAELIGEREGAATAA